jgi:hypothetical protein
VIDDSVNRRRQQIDEEFATDDDPDKIYFNEERLIEIQNGLKAEDRQLLHDDKIFIKHMNTFS